jgi:hypothetical protein
MPISMERNVKGDAYDGRAAEITSDNAKYGARTG